MQGSFSHLMMPIHVVALFVASMPLHAVAFLAVHRLPSEIFNASFTGESQALHVKPHLNNTGSSFGAEPISWGPGPRSILIRYAIFDAPPSVGFHYFGIPALLASMCQIEDRLAPATLAHPFFGQLPSYMVYTDNRSDAPVREFLNSYRDIASKNRVQVINLDFDAAENRRISEFQFLKLEPVNAASLRRAFADMIYLPAGRPKLLLGLDVSFLGDPVELLETAAHHPTQSVVYMASPGWPYKIRGYVGPQCPGMIGDFIYVNPGTPFDMDSFTEKVKWYASLPVNSERHTPPCTIPNLGYGAIDQFARMLMLSEWVASAQPDANGSPGSCLALSSKYLHAGNGGRPPSGGEVVLHDKAVSVRHASCPNSVRSFMKARGYIGW